MKTSLTIALVTWFLVTLPSHEARAEMVGPQPAERVVLNSPCDAQAAIWSKQSLLVATVTGQAGFMPPFRLRELLAKLDNDALAVHADLVQCWSAEAAYYGSAFTNRGSPGQAETAAYTAAYNQLASDVTSLLGRFIPGENLFDRWVNDEIKIFYETGLSSMDPYPNMASVRGLGAGALAGAKASLEQIAQPCRQRNRALGTQDCDALEAAIDSYTRAFKGLVQTAAPQVASLTASLNNLAAAKNNLLSALQQTMGQAQFTQAVIPIYVGQMQAYLYWFNVNAWWYGYWCYNAYVAAVYGWWSGYYYFMQLANISLYWAQVCLGAAMWYQYVVGQCFQQLERLRGAMFQYERALMENNNATNVTKGQIRDLPVAGMLSLPVMSPLK